MTVSARITGSGSYLPAKVLTNKDLEKIVDTTEEWIFSRSGIRQRHIAAEGEFTSDLALACWQATTRALFPLSSLFFLSPCMVTWLPTVISWLVLCSSMALTQSPLSLLFWPLGMMSFCLAICLNCHILSSLALLRSSGISLKASYPLLAWTAMLSLNLVALVVHLPHRTAPYGAKSLSSPCLCHFGLV